MSDPTAVVGRRIVAYLLDLAVGIAVFLALFFSIAKTDDSGADCDDVTAGSSVQLCFSSGDTVRYATGGDAATIFLPPLIVWLGNVVIVQGATGASLGKHVMGLRVVNRDGSPHGIPKALGRWAMLIVDNQPCGLPIVGFVCALATRGHRRVGDMVLGTYVITKAAAGRPVLAGEAAPAPVGAFGGPPPPPGWPPTPPGPSDRPPPPPGGDVLPPPPPPR